MLRILRRVLQLLATPAIYLQLEQIVTTQAQLVQALQDLTTKVSKIGAETATLIQKINDLQDALDNEDVSEEVQSALDALQAQVTVVDGLVPDLNPPPEVPTGG